LHLGVKYPNVVGFDRRGNGGDLSLHSLQTVLVPVCDDDVGTPFRESEGYGAPSPLVPLAITATLFSKSVIV
jgi:hypothetical protein